MAGPLDGVRVVELAGIGPAPHACLMPADLGADVIRVERRTAGEPAADCCGDGTAPLGYERRLASTYVWVRGDRFGHLGPARASNQVSDQVVNQRSARAVTKQRVGAPRPVVSS
jgi:hypothetical protein